MICFFKKCYVNVNYKVNDKICFIYVDIYFLVFLEMLKLLKIK